MAWTPEKTGNQILDRVLQGLAPVVRVLEGNVFRVVTIRRDITIVSTQATRVYHGLNRPITGYIVIRNNTNMIVYEQTQTTGAEAASFVNIRGTASGKVSLLFF